MWLSPCWWWLAPAAALSSGTGSNLLFADQQKAMAALALDEARTMKTSKELTVPKSKPRKGTGFGKPEENATSRLARALLKDGVVRVDKALTPHTAEWLRCQVIDEIDDARRHVAEDPSASMSRFHAREEQSLRSFVLLPMAPLERATRELLAPGSPLGDIFERVCGLEATLWDFYALRTEPGSPRQPVHFDTPFRDPPPLYAAFVALQDVSLEMGPTTFLPKTHCKSSDRREYDAGQLDPQRRLDMLARAAPKHALLQAGDAALFDMRVLHFGQANHAHRGAKRIMWNITFRNHLSTHLDADTLGHLPCIRPGFKTKLTLQSLRNQLDQQTPFGDLGDGLT